MYVFRMALSTLVGTLALSQMALAAPPPPPAALASPVPVTTPSALPAAAASTQPAPVVVPLTDAEQKDPAAGLAAVKRTIGGDAWSKFGSVYITGVAQVQNQALAFTYAADLRTGFNRMIVLLPHNAGTYEYGVDKNGGWSASGGFIRPFNAPAAAVKTSMYVNRLGFLNPADSAALKEVGVDPKLGDRIIVTPAGGAQVLVLIKPATSLISAVQYANGQLDIYADYRRVQGVLYPYRMMQGTTPQNLSVFQATKVEFGSQAADPVSVNRPSLPVATPAPQTKSAVTPAPRPTHKP